MSDLEFAIGVGWTALVALVVVAGEVNRWLDRRAEAQSLDPERERT